MIRLSRVGKKKQAEYRLIINEKQKDPWGKVTEFLGYYNPGQEPPVVDFKVDRIKYWLSQGAQPSDTVRNLLISEKIIEGDKVKPTGIKPMKKKEMKAAGDKKDEKPAEGKPKEDKAEAKAEEPKPEAKEEAKPEEKKEGEAEVKEEVKKEEKDVKEDKPKEKNKEDKKE